MLTLEDPEYKHFPRNTMDNKEINKEKVEESYEKNKYPVVNGEILRMALLSAKDDDDIESQEDDDVSSELLSINSEITNESTVSDWEDLKATSSPSYVTSIPNNKEFIIITQLESDNGLMTKKLSNEYSLANKKSKSRNRSKRHNKVLLLRKLIAEHEPLVEIKEEEHSIISTDVDERVPNIEEIEYEESSIDQPNVDSKDNVDWLQNFRPLPLYHTERGKPYLKCPACGAIFFTSNSFQKHLYSHIYKEEDTFVCSFCNYTNTEPGMLLAHLSKHQDQCEFCNENLMRKNNFEKHWNINTLNFSIKRDHRGKFVCTLCRLVFDLLPQLEKHWLKHACRRERTYQCKECSGLYESRETLNNHKCLKCPVCGKVYDSLHRLKAHTVWTKHNLKCPICLYEFILSMDHEKHLALHRQTYHSMKNYEYCLQGVDGKTFQCNLCDKLFYALPPLVLHLRDDHNIKDVRKTPSKENEYNGEQKEESVGEILRRVLKSETVNYVSTNDNTT